MSLVSRNVPLLWVKFDKFKQKSFVICCAEEIVPRLGQDEFQIVAKLSACQISGTRGEGLGKSLMRVLFTQGYPREKMPFTMLGLSVYFFFISEPVDYKFINTIRMLCC